MVDQLPQSQANAGLRRQIERAIASLWPSLPLDDAARTRDLLLDTVPELTAVFGDVAATVAADRYDQVLGDSGVRVPTAALAPPVEAGAVEAGVRWSVGPLFGADADTLAALARLQITVDRLAIGRSDETMRINAERDHIRFAWVPYGKTCAFCTMLGSRGPVYRSQESGLAGRHSHCDCSIEPVASEADLDRLASQNGYRPDTLYAAYREAADASSGGTRSVLAEMRRQNSGMS